MKWSQTSLQILHTPNQPATETLISSLEKYVPHSKQKNFSCVLNLCVVYLIPKVNLCDSQDKKYETNKYIPIARRDLTQTEFTFFLQLVLRKSVNFPITPHFVMLLILWARIKAMHHVEGREGLHQRWEFNIRDMNFTKFIYDSLNPFRHTW